MFSLSVRRMPGSVRGALQWLRVSNDLGKSRNHSQESQLMQVNLHIKTGSLRQGPRGLGGGFKSIDDLMIFV